jgi:hypothetical protein
MEDNDIEKLFSKVAQRTMDQRAEVRDVFAVLVRTTLRYRDDMLESKGLIITVEDVRVTLECLIPFLETGRLPETADKIKPDLLKMWKDALGRLENSHRDSTLNLH